MDPQEENINKLMAEFKEEIKGITDIDELKDLFASEIARRDLVIEELKQQNQVLLKSAFKQKKEAITLNKD
jgi:hypothetical protein